MKNVDEIADFLGISVKSVRNKMSKRNIHKIKTFKGRSLYSYEQIQLLTKKVPAKKLPEPEIFYIYQSKMNYENT
jgi:hypothetical protein